MHVSLSLCGYWYVSNVMQFNIPIARLYLAPQDPSPFYNSPRLAQLIHGAGPNRSGHVAPPAWQALSWSYCRVSAQTHERLLAAHVLCFIAASRNMLGNDTRAVGALRACVAIRAASLQQRLRGKRTAVIQTGCAIISLCRL